MDKAGANFESCLKSIEKKLKTLPIGPKIFFSKIFHFIYFTMFNIRKLYCLKLYKFQLEKKKISLELSI